MNEKLIELEKKLEANNELIEELEGDLEADKDDEFWSGMSFGKYMIAKGKRDEIISEINKIKKEQES